MPSNQPDKIENQDGSEGKIEIRKESLAFVLIRANENGLKGKKIKKLEFYNNGVFISYE